MMLYVTRYSMITGDSGIGWDTEVTGHSLTEVLSQRSGLGRDSNWMPPEYESGVLPLVSDPLLTRTPTT